MTRALRARFSVSLVLPVAAFALFGATHCGGVAQSNGGGASAGRSGSDGVGRAGDSGLNAAGAGVVNGSGGGGGRISGGAGASAAGASNTCGHPPSMPTGRPEAVACPASTLNAPSPSPCSVDSDCSDAGSDVRCLHGKCSVDQCQVDADCATGTACRCAAEQHGNIVGTNSCVPSGCRVDADCGPGGTCSPDYSGWCGSLSGYECHSATDTCRSDADCCGDPPECDYQPELGHWACAALTVCNG